MAYRRVPAHLCVRARVHARRSRGHLLRLVARRVQRRRRLLVGRRLVRRRLVLGWRVARIRMEAQRRRLAVRQCGRRHWVNEPDGRRRQQAVERAVVEVVVVDGRHQPCGTSAGPRGSEMPRQRRLTATRTGRMVWLARHSHNQVGGAASSIGCVSMAEKCAVVISEGMAGSGPQLYYCSNQCLLG